MPTIRQITYAATMQSSITITTTPAIMPPLLFDELLKLIELGEEVGLLDAGEEVWPADAGEMLGEEGWPVDVEEMLGEEVWPADVGEKENTLPSKVKLRDSLSKISSAYI